MPRRGYDAEYYIKRFLEEKHGRGNVIKTTCSQNVPDFIVLKGPMGPLGAENMKPFGVEVKTTKEKKLRISPHDLKQFLEFVKWHENTGHDVMYAIVMRRTGHPNMVHWLTLDEFKGKHLSGKEGGQHD